MESSSYRRWPMRSIGVEHLLAERDGRVLALGAGRERLAD
jgi:hypothetical protein